MSELKVKDKVMDTRNYRIGKVIEKKGQEWYLIKFRDAKHLGDKGNGIEKVHKSKLVKVEN